MHSIDVTRNHFQPAKHYSGLLTMAGAVALDSDVNENNLIQQSEHRRMLTDLLCTDGSPDDGMQIGPLSAPSGYDFAIGAGVFYLGGMRLDVDEAERFRLQSEYLQIESTPRPPNLWLDQEFDAVPPTIPTAPRVDFVWVEAREAIVTGSEDSESIETALAVESSARLRPTRQVHLFADSPRDDCKGAFDALVEGLEDEGKCTFKPDTAELASNRRLTVDFTQTAQNDNPCSPPTRGGYLGAENETIQIRIIAPDRFVWGIGNAAPLYRCRMAANGKVQFLTKPRDELARPLPGDVLELLRCDAILPNGELIAEQHGVFYQVKTPYDPADNTAEFVTAGAWDFDDDHSLVDAYATKLGLANPDDHFFVRLWRGETIASTPVGQPIASAPNWTLLGNTGLRVQFEGNGPVGDYWVFSVRPNTPETIVPWEMRKQAPPTGPRRYIAPLGLIRWQTDGNAIVPRFHDCRKYIRKLSRASSCCEITVGDGHESHGDVDTIEQAIARLPEAGGKICLLRGNHIGNAVLDDVENVTIEGCGRLTRLHGRSENGDFPIITIIDSANVTIRNFTIEAPLQPAIFVNDTTPGDFGAAVKNIAVQDMRVLARDASAVLFDGGEGFALTDSRFEILPLNQAIGGGNSAVGTASAIVLLGRDMRVEGCRIEPFGGGGERPRRPVGGIHVLGGSHDVSLRRNRIRGGSGTGILLGSVRMVREESATHSSGTPQYARMMQPSSFNPGAADVAQDTDSSEVGTAFAASPANEEAEGMRPEIRATTFSSAVPYADWTVSPEDWVNERYRWDNIRGLVDLSVPLGVPQVVTDDGCVKPETSPHPIDDPVDGGRYVPKAEPQIVKLAIIENEISDMGGCGIAPYAQFDILRSDESCGVVDVVIRGNSIRGCTWREGAVLEGGEYVYSARGGIILAYARNLVCENNDVADCGTERFDPVCGFFATILDFAQLRENRIVNNGRRLPRDENVPLGRRGGIVICLAQPSFTPINSRRQNHGALIIHNNVVGTPAGRALEIQGSGSISVTDNQLTSLGMDPSSAFARWWASANHAIAPTLSDAHRVIFAANPFQTFMGAPVVAITALGESPDGKILGLGNWAAAAEHDGRDDFDLDEILAGRVCFSDNQTRFFPGFSTPQTMRSLILLASQGDVHVADNQCDADQIAVETTFAHCTAIGASVQMSNNRFSEPLAGEVALSGHCRGRSVLMHHNFGTHCFAAEDFAEEFSIIGPNRSLQGDERCRNSKEVSNDNYTYEVAVATRALAAEIDYETYIGL